MKVQNKKDIKGRLHFNIVLDVTVWGGGGVSIVGIADMKFSPYNPGDNDG